VITIALPILYPALMHLAIAGKETLMVALQIFKMIVFLVELTPIF